MLQVFLRFLNQMLDVVNDEVGPSDVVHVEIQGDSLNVSSRVQVDNGIIELNSFLSLLENAIQSKFEILSDETLQLVIWIAHAPQGGGRQKLSHIFNSEFVQKKMQHLYVFHNKDNLCFALCVSQLLNPDKNIFQVEQIARQLQHDVGLSVNDMVSFADVVRFEQRWTCNI